MKLYLKEAVLICVSGKYILEKGSILSKRKLPSLLTHPFNKKYDDIMKYADEDFILTKNYNCSSLSSSASFILGRPANGRNEWKDEFGKQAREVLNFEGQVHNEDDIIIIEDFLRDIELLDKLDPYSNKFNSFDVLNIVDSEIRHSNVLGWLLDPNETHELDSEFIKRIIRDIYLENEDSEVYNHLILSEIFLMDFDDFEIRREWKNIDLLAISEKYKFVLVIENKIWADESKNQLEKYTNIINKDYPGYKVMQVFLSPDKKTPSHEGWGIYSYKGILNNLEQIVELVPRKVSRNFIKQYIDILRRNIVGDKNLQELCFNIYKKHKRALDLIFENKPDHYSTVHELILEAINSHEELKIDHHSKSYIKFYTDSFDESIPKLGIDWTQSRRIILYEIENVGDSLSVYLRVGPCEEGLRNSILEYIDLHESKLLIPVRTRAGALKSKKWASIYKRKIIATKNYAELEYDDLKSKINTFFDKFVSEDLDRLNNIISGMIINDM